MLAPPTTIAAESGHAVKREPVDGGRGLAIAVLAALVAGAVAITVNILVLNGLDTADIVTARGGLQKLVQTWLSVPLTQAGANDVWFSLGLPGPDAPLFRTGFKVAVGLLMALAYALLLEPALRGGWLRKGLVAAIPFWLLNALAVLPLLGEGVAGIRTLTPVGLLSYAVAHTLFFVVLAGVCDALLRQRRG